MADPSAAPSVCESALLPPLPRISILFCTQCRWMLRAAYYAQELLSTFSTALGEVALQPGTGGVFRVTIETAGAAAEPAEPAESEAQAEGSISGATLVDHATPPVRILWDRKADGGFPEVKELKRRVRDIVAPGRDLGHVDRHSKGGGSMVAAAPGGDAKKAEAAEEGTERREGGGGQEVAVAAEGSAEEKEGGGGSTAADMSGGAAEKDERSGGQGGAARCEDCA